MQEAKQILGPIGSGELGFYKPRPGQQEVHRRSLPMRQLRVKPRAADVRDRYLNTQTPHGMHPSIQHPRVHLDILTYINTSINHA